MSVSKVLPFQKPIVHSSAVISESQRLVAFPKFRKEWRTSRPVSPPSVSGFAIPPTESI
ncbi:MAG TPA: hypothetical protein VGI92_12405 [Gemmatimonadales bacterium]|jgi:hypothetical protein